MKTKKYVPPDHETCMTVADSLDTSNKLSAPVSTSSPNASSRITSGVTRPNRSDYDVDGREMSVKSSFVNVDCRSTSIAHLTEGMGNKENTLGGKDANVKSVDEFCQRDAANLTSNEIAGTGTSCRPMSEPLNEVPLQNIVEYSQFKHPDAILACDQPGLDSTKMQQVKSVHRKRKRKTFALGAASQLDEVTPAVQPTDSLDMVNIIDEVAGIFQQTRNVGNACSSVYEDMSTQEIDEHISRDYLKALKPGSVVDTVVAQTGNTLPNVSGAVGMIKLSSVPTRVEILSDRLPAESEDINANSFQSNHSRSILDRGTIFSDLPSLDEAYTMDSELNSESVLTQDIRPTQRTSGAVCFKLVESTPTAAVIQSSSAKSCGETGSVQYVEDVAELESMQCRSDVDTCDSDAGEEFTIFFS
jgi:hypothetical protein